MPSKKEIQTVAQELSKRLSDQGRLIEAGWVMLRAMAVPPDMPQMQVNEMRYAFMAGAQHLFASIMTILDPGEEPTYADLARLEKIHIELDKFRQEMELRHGAPKGTG